MTPRQAAVTATATGFAYEAAALASRGRLPPITTVIRRHRLLGALALAWLWVHLDEEDPA